ncbi:MAG: terpene cyclase/mutase family protein [Flavobacteriales bacterium]|nr:MAG: terpene cyclase/mutase family protein [Flavobacteriales bacterium]
MRTSIVFGLSAIAAIAGTAALLSFTSTDLHTDRECCMKPDAARPKGCVFKTVYEGEGLSSNMELKTPAEVMNSQQRAYDWMKSAQHNDGGFAAGNHASQNVMDPHASPSDPATTAMVAMALLRAGSTPESGPYANILARSTEFLLGAVEKSDENASNITALQGTQIQVKLGANIDVALTSQYISNLIGRMPCTHPQRDRWLRAQDKCVRKIQLAQAANGAVQGGSWAGVLQSSFATNALESAQHNGADVDDEALDRARSYQKANFDASSGTVATGDAAGITLYAVSGSTRSSAKEARKAEEDVKKLKDEGKLAAAAPVSVENLQQAGYSRDEAEKMNTAWNVYNAAKVQAQSETVLQGFGNNGGEEFLSFLQTGESLIINNDQSWKDWYSNTTARLVNIQNENGSWSGHHCITSPVFCTATALLILSVNNDIDMLVAQGATVKK